MPRALRASGAVVGYLGDGINDAPALHTADVGISVDTAVDVAKEAASIVLLEKDLQVLLHGVGQGRRTFANTMKYVFTTTSANFGNMLSMAVAAAVLPFLPLLVGQILLINFLTDFPATTIATDAVDPEQLDQPHSWDIGFVRRFMLVFGAISSIFDLLTFAVLRLGFAVRSAHAAAVLPQPAWPAPDGEQHRRRRPGPGYPVQPTGRDPRSRRAATNGPGGPRGHHRPVRRHYRGREVALLPVTTRETRRQAAELNHLIRACWEIRANLS